MWRGRKGWLSPVTFCLLVCFKQLNLVPPTPEESPSNMNETSHINS